MKSQKYTLNLTEFRCSDGVILPGLLYEPKRKTKKAAIYLHGNGSSSVFYSVARMNILAEELAKINIAFFPFNNRGAQYLHKNTVKGNPEMKEIKSGTAYELIDDCIKDIEGAIKKLIGRGYTEIYLIGLSTGANKIVVYNLHRPKNKVKGYILLSGGDDTGIYYSQLGRKKFCALLEKCKKKIGEGRGERLIGTGLSEIPMSYNSIFDTINPDGNYNTFPFYEQMSGLKLSKKQLFVEFGAIKKPMLIVYGEKDEYCYGNATLCAGILLEKSGNPKKHTLNIIRNADHGFRGKEKELSNIICRWLSAQK
ncbi:MAG: DUF1749 domain-containing protein [Candidatus Aenigmarchaeota archaeon]|nr:DUF1749 domain-containing protein [Candidatus Aenigmarchaeota archaeon]